MRTLPALVTAAALLGTLPSTAFAEPRALVSQSTVTTATGRITLFRTPVVTGTGDVIYKDITIDLNVSANGTVTYASPRPAQPVSPRVLTSGLSAGRFEVEGLPHVFTLTGPGIGPNSRSTWTLTSPATDCLTDMNLVTGPINGHPHSVRLKAANITLPYIYGISDTAFCTDAFLAQYYDDSKIVAFEAIPNGLIVRSFSSQGSDLSQPTRSVTLSRCTEAAPAC